jgi:hypothetical protein
MTENEFDDQLRALVRQRPFRPFEIELLDGQRLWIDDPQALGFDGGGGSFIDPDEEIHFFNHATVRRIGEASREPSA